MAFFSGKTGSLTVGGTAQPLTDWSIDIKSENIDTTNFSDVGYQTNSAGVGGAEITASGPYDGTAGASVGASVAFILVASGDVGAPSITVTARISSIKVDVNVKGVAQISYTASSNGSFSSISY
jgi:hypothetical protein